MDKLPFEIPLPLALAVIAFLGYLVGLRSRRQAISDADKARRELRRAKAVAKELELIAQSVRKNLASHHLSVARFKERVSELSSQEKEAAWQELCREAEQVLKPTLRLAEQIAQAYDEIRQQTNHLMTFTEVRTDPLTRVSNRRGLDRRQWRDMEENSRTRRRPNQYCKSSPTGCGKSINCRIAYTRRLGIPG